MTDYDTIIIGAGPAGLTAGLYCGRRNMKTLILSEDIGGQMALAHLVENYPGIEAMSGIEMAETMRKQAEKFGSEIKLEKVIGMNLKGEVKKIKSDGGEYTAKTVIIASGAMHRKLNVEGEDKFMGKGVSYCATCDGPLFKGKRIAVVGGSDCAMISALYLAEVGREVYMIHRRNEFRAEEANQAKLKRSKIKLILNSVVEKIEGDKFVKNLKIKNLETNKISDLPIDGVFIEVGHIPTSEIAKKAGIEINENGFIKCNEKRESNIKGVFVAGDITGGIAQISVAVGEGAVAAMSAYSYIHESDGGKTNVVDWGTKKVTLCL